MAEITKVNTLQLSDFRSWIYDIPFDFTQILTEALDAKTNRYTYVTPSGNKSVDVYEDTIGNDGIIEVNDNGRITTVWFRENGTVDVERNY